MAALILFFGAADKWILVQCKRWTGRPVNVETVRELFGVLHHRNASAAKLVATTNFTSEAVAFAEGKPIELVDAEALIELLRGVQTSGRIAAEHRTELHRSAASGTSVFPSSSLGTSERIDATPVCPKCGASMKLREARRGANAGKKFWGCTNYPKCNGTRDA